MSLTKSQKEARRSGGLLVQTGKEVGNIIYHLDAERLEKKQAKQEEKTKALALRKFSWEA